MQRFNITVLIPNLTAGTMILTLAACGIISERIAAIPVNRVATLPPTQACDAAEETQGRLTGAYLRQSDATGLTFVPVLVAGRNTRNTLNEEITLNDRTQTREVEDARGLIFIGPEDALAKARLGFGPTDSLPNVYDVNYSIDGSGFSGPMVVGPAAVLAEVPTSGARLFSGPVAVQVITQNDEGETSTASASGRFSMQAGYGSGLGSFTASGFGGDLPFDTLNWTNLLLCGTRFVSSGSGMVTVQTDGGAPIQPFKEGRAAVPMTALFESSQFSPEERPALPTGIGGVLVVQSDKGTLTAVFLSDDPPVTEPAEGEDA